MVPLDVPPSALGGAAVLFAGSVGFPVAVGVFVVFVLVAVAVDVDDSEGETDDDPDGDTDENTVDVIPAVVSAVLEAGRVVGDSLLDPTLAVGDCDDDKDGPGGGKSQVHPKLKVWPAAVPAPTKSILNCILSTPQSVLPVPSQ